MSELRRVPTVRDRQTKWEIQCDCGRLLPMSTYTECDQCGAHYEVNLKQTAPPIGARDIEMPNGTDTDGSDVSLCYYCRQPITDVPQIHGGEAWHTDCLEECDDG